MVFMDCLRPEGDLRQATARATWLRTYCTRPLYVAGDWPVFAGKPPFLACAPGRIRTCDTGFRRAVLYPLSYEGEGPAETVDQNLGR